LTVELIANGSVTSPIGFRAAAVTCGLKASGRPDLALVVSDKACPAAGVFTTNQVAAAPVLLDKATLAANPERIKGVVINAGNANACTGGEGLAAAQAMQAATAAVLGGMEYHYLVMSTGIIGVPLPVDLVRAGIAAAGRQLGRDNGPAAAAAIMTTDTRPKQLAVQVSLSGGTVTIGGMAKGSGMIHPNMATMLAVLTTDAQIAPELLWTLLRRSVNHSFNRITVDGDTSTNDAVLLLANGQSGISLNGHDDGVAFAAGLDYVCRALAQMIVRDGEGATKFVEIEVAGAAKETDAHAVASTIATSPLVKTALAGHDPNWGRILAAAGRAGVPFDQEQVALWVEGIDGERLQLVANGRPTAFAESQAAAIFAGAEIGIRLELGQGAASAVVWTCDLTHDYVSINTDYRT
jgi:glutamate N-acetyltransferase / amino-acid N-acetyltransferase